MAFCSFFGRTITVRKPNDYVSAMIGLAGGIYSLGNYMDEEKMHFPR